MVSFPNCKINLGLHVVAKRADGYHDLESVFYPVALNDILEVIPASEMHFVTSGLPISGSVDSNLCIKAWQLLKRDYPSLPYVSVYLHKVIPMGAGLGGGSSDGAFMLQLLSNNFGLALSTDQLLSYALELGSDCPFFILNTPAMATGRGEHLSPCQIDLSQFTILIVFPGIHVSTASAFSSIRPARSHKSIIDILEQPIATWRDELKNDFEPYVFSRHPEIALIKTTLYDQGALYASMSGSGSAVYGIFEKTPTLSMRQGWEVFVV
ncbi:4-(cytidine 5'-diphospho)-2-C-methyl-D-erythritol kinase [Segetibacter sp. 3557_3]|uniref:4-(cytidine 5'-diphospho)-2-C-methyl-D-erythritol kinase n=1 Tax=Segetibacter sp. 3557_3 TaxID=2547429 RepID=UPI0010584732|nr:4-(cytidine 5'-diphospho)-2-C-methyl-D-erythritol kinase [Segetibacter sp. 3557_3]TDH28926.1 4-(cytidine 5'-diphospho)-2-C-methyl-D-erythritol kinase [Segetibacter sp. 3557_3]